MKIKVKLVSMPGHQPAGFDDGGNALLQLDDKSTVSDMMSRLALSELEIYMVLVNGETIPPSEREDHLLKDGDDVAVFPPMEGG